MNQERTFHIPVPAPFRFEECLWFLDRNYDDCMHTIQDQTIVKALQYEGNMILIRISKAPDGLDVSLLEGHWAPAMQQWIEAYIHDWFDLGRDITPFYQLLQKQKKLSYMTDAFHGLRLLGIPDLFEALCWSIIGQQINLSFAYRLKRRLTEHYGQHMLHNGVAYYVFPEYATLAGADISHLRDMQFSQKKAEYLQGLAAVFDSGDLSKASLVTMGSFEAQQQALTALRGIGIWTANYALMKSLRVAEAIPYGDVGLLQGLVNHGLIKDRKDQAGIDRLFHKFKDWETYLVFYLWRSLAVPA